MTASPNIHKAMTVSQMTGYFERVGFTAQIDPSFQGLDVLQVTTDTGSTFYTALRGCDAGGACDLLDVFGYFNSGGLTLDQVNTIHGNDILGSMIILMPNGIGITAKKVFLEGGVTEKNLDIQFAVFLIDIELAVGRAQSAVTASVEGRTENFAPIPASMPVEALAGPMFNVENPVVNFAAPDGFAAGYFAPLLDTVTAERILN